MTLPAALKALEPYPQFILWRLTDDLPPRKVPISPLTGQIHNAHDPSIWMSYDQAFERVGLWACNGVAFVLTDTDPFWFLDIDACRTGNDWSPLAHQLCGMFAGAAIEVSQSGQGLHVIASGQAPPHGCKSKLAKIELYTKDRFIALTGTGATGDAGSDHTAAVAQLVATWFSPEGSGSEAGAAEAWLDQADPSYTGPSDDGELLRIMSAARASVSHVLDGKATLPDLLNNNIAALAATYPAINPLDPYDRSQADAALAQHLAFWTGKNTERIRRLMRQSKLARPKWDEHRSYLWRTISRACGLQRTVYTGRQAPPAAPAALNGHDHTAEVPLPTGMPAQGLQWLTVNQQPEFFQGCVYVLDQHRIYTPEGAMLKPEQFRVMYGGYSFSMDMVGDRVSRNAWEVFTESQGFRFPKVESTCFRPEIPPGTIVQEEGQRLLNTYHPINTLRIKGDPQPFLNHVAKLLPVQGDQDIFIAYLAALVQHPGVKFQWCPVIQGAEGNGKTVFIRSITHCLGSRFTHLPNAADLGGGGNGAVFTGWLAHKLFIGIEEIKLADRADILDALKPLVTNDRVEIQGKGVDQVTGDNRANIIMCCNAKESIAVGYDKRRYCIFYTAQQDENDLIRDEMDGLYFPKLYKWLKADGYAIVNEFLHTYAIPEMLNPADLCHRAPRTSSTDEMLALSAGPVEQEIVEAVSEGRSGFCLPWISSLALDRLLQSIGKSSRIAYRKRREILRQLGYDWHPHLVEGRVNNPMPSEGMGKPRLFIKKGHLACNLTEPTKIVEAYIQAQGGLGAPVALPSGMRQR